MTSQHAPTHRVLVVDDEPLVLEAYRTVLSSADPEPGTSVLRDLEAQLFGTANKIHSAATFDTVFCRSGEDAVRAVTEARQTGREFATAFLDVRMPPGIDGIETAARIRALDADVNIVIVTAYTDFRRQEIAARVPPLDKFFYLTKPLHAIDVQQFAFALAAKWTLERELRRVNEDLSVRCFELEATQAQLREAQKLEAIGQLTGGVAHDFNNLLTVVIGNLEMAAQQVDAQSGTHTSITAALQAAESGANLVRRLLAFARRQALLPDVIDLNELVNALIPLLKLTLGDSIGIDTVLAGDLWPTLADQGQIQNSLINLAINARDAMPNGGRITIETANAVLDEHAFKNGNVVPGEYTMVAVTDNGTGMPPDVLGRALEPFYTTKEVGKGSGLGLSMIYGFVMQSGGHLKISSEPGHGTTVRIYLPRAAAAARQKPPAVASEELPGGAEVVLVVEDEEGVRRLVAAQLSKLGYRVLEAADGAAAEVILRSDPSVQLLLTDIIMPGGMSGRDLVKRARELRNGLPVLYMTGYEPAAAVEPGAVNDRAPLLSKPYRPRDLARMVRAALDAAP